jgi:hypothetical protein
MNFRLTAASARGITLLLALIILSCSSDPRLLKKDESIVQYRRMYESDDWTTRKKAVNRVSRILTPDATGLLLKATYDTHEIIRIEALTGLRRHTPQSALERIKEIAETESSSNIKWHALKTLGYYREPTAALIFAKNLKNEDWLIREESIKGLLKIDDYAIRYVSVPYVLEALGDSSMSVKLTTLKYLHVSDPRIYEKLSGMLMSAGDGQQALIEETLKALKGYELEQKTRDRVIGYLTHQNVNIRLSAHRVLISQKEKAEVDKKAPSR